jgi:hypothetical protein
MARTLVLRSSDFPAGWKATPADSRQSSTPPSKVHTTADVDSPEFAMGDAWAFSNARIAKPGEDFSVDSAFIGSSQFATMLKAEYAKGITGGNPGASVQSLTVARRQIPAYGGLSIGYRITARLKVQGLSVGVYVDAVWFQNGRIAVWVVFANFDRPLDPDLERALLAQARRTAASSRLTRPTPTQPAADSTDGVDGSRRR